MNRRFAIIVGILVVLGFVVWMLTFTVREHDQVLITRFGKIRGSAIDEPGLHFKVPIVDRVHRFDKRWLDWDGDPNQIPTRDKKYIWVDTYARWRISDPELFYKRLRDETGAQSRLDDIIDGEVRNVIANHALIEAVRMSSRSFELGEVADAIDIDPEDFAVEKGRGELRRLVLEKASDVMPDYGIELADVRIKRINYVESVQSKVFERMISERKRIAERYRSEGKGKSAEILGQVEKELRGIRSKAYKKATKIRGDADAEATAVYAEAFTYDPEFYAFMESLDTYEATVDEDTTLLLSTGAELFQYLMDAGEGSPAPPRGLTPQEEAVEAEPLFEENETSPPPDIDRPDRADEKPASEPDEEP
jgi:membrane protease subunit HflC